ncbi:MAG TPA: sporulation protein YunB [Firmicutes bacterium]|jgi:sporulation protein YunB|nr:sporulation protein YunB [Bacillota bacterium]
MRYNLNKRFIFFQVPPYRKRRFRSLTFLGVLVLSLVVCFYIVDFRVRPTLRNLAEAKARVIATQAINEAVRSNISPDIQYQNLIKVQLNSEGKVALIQPNTGEINRIASEATLAVQRRLRDLPRILIRIPFGQIAGSKIMAGFGPDIVVKVTPIGFVESTINDRFDLAGINQVRHRIYVTVKAVVKMVVPLVSQEVQVSTDIPLVEAVIMGEVPEVYVGNGNGVILPAKQNK